MRMFQLVLVAFLFNGLSLLPFKMHAQEKLFDQDTFKKLEHTAQQLIINEDLLDYATDRFIREFKEVAGHSYIPSLAYPDGEKWNVLFFRYQDSVFSFMAKYQIDSILKLTDTLGTSLTSRDTTLIKCLIKANSFMSPIMDTNEFYFSTLLLQNENKSISVYYFPAFQPSGQALYGVEWCFTFNDDGSQLLSKQFNSIGLNSVWIGQPREYWLKYRELDIPTVESLFFALKYRDYFTRLRIDFKNATCTTSRNAEGNYTWDIKLK